MSPEGPHGKRMMMMGGVAVMRKCGWLGEIGEKQI